MVTSLATNVGELDCDTELSGFEDPIQNSDVESPGQNLELSSSEVVLKSPLYLAPFRLTKCWPIFTLSIMLLNW
jgi:hypothetical protein